MRRRVAALSGLTLLIAGVNLAGPALWLITAALLAGWLVAVTRWAWHRRALRAARNLDARA